MGYRKHRIHMTGKGKGSAVCIIEEYKEKRAIHLFVSNLTPSLVLSNYRGMKYQVLIMGYDGDSLVHKNLGNVHIGANGNGKLKARFSCDESIRYSYCLLMAVNEKTLERENVLVGAAEGESKQVYIEETKLKEPKIENTFIWKLKSAYEECREEVEFSEKVDETGAEFKRVNFDGKHGHYIIGRKIDSEKDSERWFIGIPGRFLKGEKPENKAYSLWQPISGGEEFYDTLENMGEGIEELICGYWIAEIDSESGELKIVHP